MNAIHVTRWPRSTPSVPKGISGSRNLVADFPTGMNPVGETSLVIWQ